MPSTKISTSKLLLNSVPDFFDWQQASQWIETGQKQVQLLNFQVSEEAIFSLTWKEIAQSADSVFGYYASENWRKFVLTVFFADLISYPLASDQVNFERLLFVMHLFPEGFTTWWIRLENGSWWPIGYTGWYPMLETSYELFKNHPEKVKDRTVIPNLNSQNYLYLFNYSLYGPLRRSFVSQQLIKKFAAEILAQNAKGLACITVSEDGARIAKRFGLQCVSHIGCEGHQEGVYVSI